MAIRFTATSSTYISTAYNAVFSTITTAVTVCAWAYRQNDNTLQCIMSRGVPGSPLNEYYHLNYYNNGYPRFIIGDSSSVTNVIGPTYIPLNSWHHLCGTWDGTTINIYVDGELQATGTRSGTLPTDTSAPITIGCDTNNGTVAEFLTGYVEDARIYNRALSQNEVQTLYICQGHDGIVDGLVLRYPLNELRPGSSVAKNGVIYEIGPSKVNGVAKTALPYVDGTVSDRKRVMRMS
jgi:hypothetical protein